MKEKLGIKKIIVYMALIIISVIMVYPFVWSITASFKTNTQLYDGNPLDLIPRPLSFQGYVEAWTILPLYRFLLNSAMLSILVPLESIILSCMAAYSFARLKFKGRDAIFLVVLGVMMMPGHITLIPNYSIIHKLGWINNYLALIIPPVFSGSLVFNIFFMRQYFSSIPKELDESAIVDGCPRIRVLWNIIIPNAKPAIATVAIISFKDEWNTFLWPVIVINDYLKMPIQVGLSYYKYMLTTNWGAVMAGATMAIIPLIAIFLIFQRYFINSILTSGLGGR